jgi:hypothetical protein
MSSNLTNQSCSLNKVDHPAHYNHGKIEVIEVIEDWSLNFNLGNVVKYIARAEQKGNPLEDLQKAQWYLNREIELRINSTRIVPCQPT